MNAHRILSGITADSRRASLRELLNKKQGGRIMEAHSPLYALPHLGGSTFAAQDRIGTLIVNKLMQWGLINESEFQFRS